MNIRTFLLVMFLFLCLCVVQLQAANPFAKRITGTIYHKVMTNPAGRLHQEVYYNYTNTEPCMLTSMRNSTTTITATDSTTVEILSNYESNVQTIGDLTQVEYFEFRSGNPELYGYFRFRFNPDGNLVEFNVRHPDLQDSLHAYLSYRAVDQPDSMYYMKSVNSNVTYYKFFYDEENRLDYSLQYLYDTQSHESTLYRRFNQTYAAFPVHFTTPLDFINYRFYNMSGNWNGAFEESAPIFDLNYAPQSIAFEQWDNWNEAWFPVTTSFYGVQTTGEQIALINGQPGDYTGYWYFDDNGNYVSRHVNSTDGSYNDYQIIWAYGTTPNPDPVTTPLTSVISAFPNPFKADLTINLANKERSLNDISIYNIKGQLIRSWNGMKTKELQWDGKDMSDKPVSSGIYLIKARQDRKTSILKVIRL